MAARDDPHRYDDIIDLPHPRSAAHPPMPPEERAAIFSAFAALNGYDARIREAARLTASRLVPDESAEELLDRKLQTLLCQTRAHKRPLAGFLFYKPDERKEGGAYERLVGAVRRIDTVHRQVILCAQDGLPNGLSLPIDDIVSIELMT